MEHKVGTSGIYADLGGGLLTAAAKLGAVSDFDFFAVPGISTAISFDVFPGAPAITDGATIVFKGNYTEGTTQKTGVYYRDLSNVNAGGDSSIQLIADSNTKIPRSRRVLRVHRPAERRGTHSRLRRLRQ